MIPRLRPAQLRANCVVCLAALAAWLPVAGFACDGTLRLIAPYLPGGMAGAAGDVLADALRERLRRPVAVDFIPGNAGARAATEVAEAKDPCQVLIGSVTSVILLPAIQRHLRYDDPGSFVPIALIGGAPLLLAVHPSFEAADVHQLILRGRTRTLRFGSAGLGTISHVTAAMFARQTNLAIEHVAYEGSAEMLRDLVDGKLDAAFDNAALPHVRAGRLRALAVSSRTRLDALPRVPTVAEAGVPGFDATGWVGLFGSPAMSASTADALAADVAAVLRDPGVGQRLLAQGIQPRWLGRPAFATYVRQEAARWGREADLALKQVGRP